MDARRRWGRRLLAVATCLRLFCQALLGLLLAAVLLPVLAVTGPTLLPWLARVVRWLPNVIRELGTAPIERPYLPEPDDPDQPFWPRYRARAARVARDAAFWRDLAWLVTEPVVGTLTLLPGIAVLAGWAGLVLPGAEDWLYGFHSPLIRTVGVVAGLALMLAGTLFAPAALRLHTGWATVLLAPTKAAQLVIERDRLATRVRRLTETRDDATSVEAAELRRIERDLHDGAQARLVAMGITLDAAEQLLDNDPDAARELLAKARSASSVALAELRSLVAGILPPVLAERGLGDAVRALALDSALDVTVTVDLPGRPSPPVESAAYFAVAELLTNVAKHAGIDTASVTITHAGGLLRIVVLDHGRGGVDPDGGSGLKGIRRRLGTFDGTVTVSSPDGGPTTATLEIPCELSSPRTTTSSETR